MSTHVTTENILSLLPGQMDSTVVTTILLTAQAIQVRAMTMKIVQEFAPTILTNTLREPQMERERIITYVQSLETHVK